MHVGIAGTGFATDTTEGCLKGKYDAGGGQTYTLLGCDSVRIVPPQ